MDDRGDQVQSGEGRGFGDDLDEREAGQVEVFGKTLELSPTRRRPRCERSPAKCSDRQERQSGRWVDVDSTEANVACNHSDLLERLLERNPFRR